MLRDFSKVVARVQSNSSMKRSERRISPISTNSDGVWALLVFLRSLGGASKEEQPNQHEHGNHDRQAIFPEKTEKTWRVYLLMIGDRFDHEVRPIADVSVRAKEDGPDA